MVLLAALCGCHPFAVFHDWHAVLQLLVYGVIGMIPDNPQKIEATAPKTIHRR